VLDVLSPNLIVVEINGSTQLWDCKTNNHMTLTPSQQAGFLTLCDGYALIFGIPNTEHQVQIINLALLANESSLPWLTQTKTFGEKGCVAAGDLVAVNFTSGSLLVVALKKCIVIVPNDDEAPAIYKIAKITARPLKACKEDVILGTIGLRQDYFLTIVHSRAEGLIRIVVVDATRPVANETLRMATLKAEPCKDAEVITSAANGVVLSYKSETTGAPIYSVVWKSPGNTATSWDGVTRIEHALVGTPVHLLVDPSSTARRATMLTAWPSRFELYLLDGATGRIELWERQKCMPLSDPYGALFVPRGMGPTHSEVEICSKAVEHLLRRHQVTAQVLAATKKQVLDSDAIATITRLQQSLSDTAKRVMAMKKTHQGATHRYETIIATMEHTAKQAALDFKSATRKLRDNHDQQREAQQAQLRAERRRADEAVEELARGQQKLKKVTAQLAATKQRLVDTKHELNEAAEAHVYMQIVHKAELDALREQHTAELDALCVQHTAELTERKTEHERTLNAATLKTEPQEAEVVNAQPERTKLVEALRLEIARLTTQCYDQNFFIQHFHGVCAGLIDPVFQTPLPQLAEQISHLNQFKRDNAVLYQQVAELRAALQEHSK
jgi:hypothetical protein